MQDQSQPRCSVPPISWLEQINRVSIPSDMAFLALKAFGVNDQLLHQVADRYGINVGEAISFGLTQGHDLPVSPKLGEFRCTPVGISELIRSLNKQTTSKFAHQDFKLKWAHDKIYTLVTKDGKPQLELDTNAPLHLNGPPEFDSWADSIRRLFLKKTASLDLMVLIPLPTPDADQHHWHMMSCDDSGRGYEGALRLLGGLCVLGLNHRKSLHRTKCLSNLVTSCSTLFKEVSVCGEPLFNSPIDDRLRGQTKKGSEGQLLFRHHDGHTQVENLKSCYPFTLNFANAWLNNPNRFSDWSIRDRAGDADEVANALQILVSHTSGICLQLSLAPRLTETDSPEHDVRILAPEPWLNFLRQGSGHKRGGKSEPFAPYKHRTDPNASLFCIDEPLSTKQIRKRLRKKGSDDGKVTHLNWVPPT